MDAMDSVSAYFNLWLLRPSEKNKERSITKKRIERKQTPSAFSSLVLEFMSNCSMLLRAFDDEFLAQKKAVLSMLIYTILTVPGGASSLSLR